MTDLQNFHAFPAPAKINLFLHVTGQRVDGYHLLQTVFRLLDYGDTIHIKPTAEHTIKRSQPVADIPEQHDLCIRAANLLQQHTGCNMGAEIAVKKNIPMGGGLGGGSSDAATVLLALNRLWGLNLKRSELIDLGLKLGADVPFFIFGSNAWAEGIGEKLQKISLKPAWYVVLTPSVHVSTAEIFANKELTKNTNPKIMSGFSGTPDLTTENVGFGNLKPEFINDLEKVVCKLYPEVKACLDWLKHHGDARMSGSGASIFLEVESQDKADSILRMKPENIFGFVAKGLDQHPLFEYAD